MAWRRHKASASNDCGLGAKRAQRIAAALGVSVDDVLVPKRLRPRVDVALERLELRLDRLEKRTDETIELLSEALELLRAAPRRRASGG